MLFDRIEVHFRSGPEKKPFRAVIRPGGPVRGMRFPAPPSTSENAAIPKGVEVFDSDGLKVDSASMIDGPLVCYLVGRQLECW